MIQLLTLYFKVGDIFVCHLCFLIFHQTNSPGLTSLKLFVPSINPCVFVGFYAKMCVKLIKYSFSSWFLNEFGAWFVVVYR